VKPFSLQLSTLAAIATVLLLAGPAPAADVTAGVALDDGGRPLARAPMQVRDTDEQVLVDSFAGDNGAYCFGHEEIDDGGDYEVCVTLAAGRSGCSSGQPNTLAGAFVRSDGTAQGRVEVRAYDDSGEAIASGKTDRDGNYCLTPDSVRPGELYRVCAPAPLAEVPGGLSGAIFGAENQPLPQARIVVSDASGEVVAEGRTTFDGVYCIKDDDLRPGVLHRMCVDVVASAATCTGGVDTAVSGAFTDRYGRAFAELLLRVETMDGTPIAEGTTDANGSYCIVNDAIPAGEIVQVCAERRPNCACCATCCAPALAWIPPPPAALIALGVGAPAIGTAVGIALLDRDDEEPEVSPSR